jgi:hypothetical protein
MDRHEACVAVLERSYLLAVPVHAGSAEEKVEGRRGEHFLQPGGLSVAGDAGIGESVAGLRAAVQCRLAFLDRWAVSVADRELREGAVNDRAAASRAQREGCKPR